MYRHFIKRLLDFIISLIAIILLIIPLGIIAIWLHFANKGAGSFFCQDRPGINERIFKVIKFKSMTDEWDAEGNLLPEKERLTKVGRFIRKFSIDELPQIINVLKGDMAIIGPRPLLPEYLPCYTEREKLRHTVRPGITGYAQSHGRNNLQWDVRLEYDAYYAENLSFKLDVQIFVHTVLNVLIHKDVNVTPGSVVKPLNIERTTK